MEKIQIHYYAQKEIFVVLSIIHTGTKFCLYSGLFLLIHGVLSTFLTKTRGFHWFYCEVPCFWVKQDSRPFLIIYAC